MLEPSTLPDQLATFLSPRLGDGQPVTISNYEEITGGYSRYMARFTATTGAETRELILRADPPPGQSIIDTDRAREWEVVNAIRAAGGIAMPEPLWFDDSGDELGSRGIIFEKLEGETLFVALQEGEVSDHFHRSEPLADLAASMHTFDHTLLPASVERPSSWSAYLDTNVAAWIDVEREHVESDPFMRLVAAWLDANRPPETDLTMVHGDLQSPNIFVQTGTGTFHMLDWELARIGDPREDLGWWALAAASQPPDLIDANPDAFYARYREQTGLSEEIVNPATVAYFTVLSSLSVFSSVIQQTAKMARGEAAGMSVAYMTNVIPFMHKVFIDSMRMAGAWRAEAS